MNRTLRLADARNRSVRTFFTSLAIDVLLSVALLVTTTFTDAEGWNSLDWKVVSFLLVKTILLSAASYVLRAFTNVLPPPTDNGDGNL